MNNSKTFNFFILEQEKPGLPENQRSLYKTVYSILYHLPLLSFFITIGVLVVYWLGYSGMLDKNEPLLLVVAGISFLTTLAQLFVFPLARRGQLEWAAFFLFLINSISASSQVFVWQGIFYVFLTIAIIPVLIYAVQRGINRYLRIASISIGVILAVCIPLLDKFLPYPRIEIGTSLTPLAALAIYVMVVTAMAALVVLDSLINFRSISGRLTSTFTFIALLSSIALLVIAALANLYFDRQKVYTELEAAARVRAFQVEATLSNDKNDVNLTLNYPALPGLLQVLNQNPSTSSSYQDALNQITSYISLQQSQNPKYQEIILINAKGRALYSTNKQNIGTDFLNYQFFQNTTMGINYSVETKFPGSFDQASVILVKPYSQGVNFLGVLAVRESTDSLKQYLVANTGIGRTAETYMVGLSLGQMISISNTLTNIDEINTKPAEEALMLQSNQGNGIWDNYVGVPVLGSYVRIPELKSVVIAEISQSEVTQKTINIALVNAIIGIFTLLLTFTIVLLTSRSIGQPIVGLNQRATDLSQGDLSARMETSRQDEIGTLANSFNSMASELQNLVHNLEGIVEERTLELRKQTEYLRVAAEVARDATTAQSLDELLNRATQLVLDRFGFYHTGIFLLDDRKEYAVLRASPTKAGQEMLARGHKLKVGQVGIVGNVSASGEPRVALDIEKDATYFKNPSLPNTQSEMALPLKVNNEMIGVLDVQSEQANAFSPDQISILQIMADQLALAIQRVKLSQEQEYNLSQLERAYQQFTYNSWSKLTKNTNFQPGYTFDGMHLNIMPDLPPEFRETLSQGKPVLLPSNSADTSTSTLAVPLKLRNQIIGVLNIELNSLSIPSETIDLFQEAANRLASSLENARLYSETQKTAERDRAVSQITTKIRSTNDPREMVQIALNELKQTLQLHDARILPYAPTQKIEKS